jgi:UDP-glucose 4-epimerase
MRTLVTGGAGYIESHRVRRLGEGAWEVVVALLSGRRETWNAWSP